MNNTPTSPVAGSGRLKKFGVPAAMLTAGLAAGMAFAPIGLASAQDDTVPDPDADGTETEAPEGRRGHRRGNRLGHLAELIEEQTGLTAEALREGFAAGQSVAEQVTAAGGSVDELSAAIKANAEEHLADAVEAERLTQDEADEKAAALDERIAERLNTVPEAREGRGGHGKRFGREALEELGLTSDEIRAGFAAGQTLAETAAADGISQDDLVDALVASATERAAEAVESGRITQDQADEKTADLEAKITERVNADPSERPEGHRGRRGGAPQNGETVTSGLDA